MELVHSCVKLVEGKKPILKNSGYIFSRPKFDEESIFRGPETLKSREIPYRKYNFIAFLNFPSCLPTKVVI